MGSQDQALDEVQALPLRVVPPRAVSEEEFLAWCDDQTRAEWVDGEVVVMVPASVEHNSLSGWLVTVLGLFVEHHDLGRVLQDVQVRLPAQRRRRSPDVLFVAAGRLALLHPTHLEGPPDLAIEIVSPESEARDWREKYLDYEAAGVREYWVIDPMSQHVEAYALRSDEAPEAATHRYRRLEEHDGAIASTVLPGFSLRTSWLWPQTRPKTLEILQDLGVLGRQEE